MSCECSFPGGPEQGTRKANKLLIQQVESMGLQELNSLANLDPVSFQARVQSLQETRCSLFMKEERSGEVSPTSCTVMAEK